MESAFVLGLPAAGRGVGALAVPDWSVHQVACCQPGRTTVCYCGLHGSCEPWDDGVPGPRRLFPDSCEWWEIWCGSYSHCCRCYGTVVVLCAHWHAGAHLVIMATHIVACWTEACASLTGLLDLLIGLCWWCPRVFYMGRLVCVVWLTLLLGIANTSTLLCRSRSCGLGEVALR